MRKLPVWTALLLGIMSAPLGAQQREEAFAKPEALFTANLAPRATAFATMRAASAWQPDAQPQDEKPQPAPSRPIRKKSKAMIVAGLALIGGGAYLLIANPDLTQQYLPTANGGLVKQGYHARLIGGALAGTGGLTFVLGMRGK
jgi:hypothetical protein